MRLKVNGQEKEFPSVSTVAGLLEGLGIDPQGVIVEVNLEILKREEHPAWVFSEGDAVEIIRMVDGG